MNTEPLRGLFYCTLLAKWWDVFFQIPWCFLLWVFLLQNEVQGGDFNDCLECLPGNLENLIQFDTHLFV